MAARVAYLACGVGCAVDRPACPYVLGFKGHKHVWKMAEEWSAAGQEWRCSAFLDIARPPNMDGYFRRRSLFGAAQRGGAQGRTTLDDSDVRWMRIHAEEAVNGNPPVTDADGHARTGPRCGTGQCASPAS
jgi:hypothetical protein